MVSLVSLTFLLCICTTTAYSSTLSASDIAQATFGTFDFKELDEILYDVEIDNFPTTVTYFDQASIDKPGADTNDDDSSEAQDKPKSHRLSLISKYGQEYLCRLPKITSGLNLGDDNDSESKLDFNLSLLLQPLAKRPCLTKTTGWWTYEYCHGKAVKQFHKEAGTATKTLILGVYENETVWNEEKINKVKNLKDSMKNNLGNNRYPVAYHGATYVNGTVCDITGKPRRAFVKIYCGVGEDKIVDIQETETCNYTIQVQTSLLCNHPFFSLTSDSKAHVLSCAPIISQEYYDRLQEKLSHGLKKAKEDDGMKSSVENDDAQTITSKKDSLSNVLTYSDVLSFLSKSDLFDSGEEEEEGEMDSERETGSTGERMDEEDAASGVEREKKKAKVSSKSDDETYQEETASKQQTKFRKKSQKLRNMIKKSKQESSDDEDEGEGEDDDEEALSLKVNQLKEAVNTLYKRLLEDLEDAEEENPAKNLLKHSIKKVDISDKDSVQTESQDRQTPTSLLKTKQSSQTDQYLEDQQYSETHQDTREDGEIHREQELSSDIEAESRDKLTKSTEHDRVEEEEELEEEEEPITVAEYLKRLKAKKTSDGSNTKSKEDPSNSELNDDELELLENMDEESLQELEEEINEELQRHLREAGLDEQAQVQVKIFNLPTSVLDSLEDLDEDDEEEDGDGTGLQETGSKKKKSSLGTVKILNVKLADKLFDGQTQKNSYSKATSEETKFSKMLNDFLNPMTPERVKVQSLENSYNQGRIEPLSEDDDDSQDEPGS